VLHGNHGGAQAIALVGDCLCGGAIGVGLGVGGIDGGDEPAELAANRIAAEMMADLVLQQNVHGSPAAPKKRAAPFLMIG
jgi:hypothetical protein